MAKSPKRRSVALLAKPAGWFDRQTDEPGERDAGKTCDTSAKEKKLSGAAKTSFTKKCLTDAVGQ